MQYEICSADSHIIEPPDLCEKWLAPEYRKHAPRLAKDDEGGDAWDFHDGGKPAPIGLVTKTAGKSYEELRWGGSKYDTINQGCFEATARVKEMTQDGLQLEVIVTFIIDHYGVSNRHAIGTDIMMWSTDYPHHGADWPYSRKVIEEMFHGVATDERNAIVAGNCIKLYGLQN